MNCIDDPPLLRHIERLGRGDLKKLVGCVSRSEAVCNVRVGAGEMERDAGKGSCGLGEFLVVVCGGELCRNRMRGDTDRLTKLVIKLSAEIGLIPP